MAETLTADTTELPPAERTALNVLLALSAGHFLNDVIQALLPSIYPTLKASFQLNFSQIGWITFAFQCTASLLQPVVGFVTDRRPQPFSLAIGMGFSLVGLVLLARAGSFHAILVASALIGTGSSIFHPEASRMARLASGGKHGFAQSLFQVGGNLGSSLGPLLAAAAIAVSGQSGILWFTALAFAGIVLLTRIGRWYRGRLKDRHVQARAQSETKVSPLARPQLVLAFSVLIGLIISKYIYLASLSSYYTFYLIHRFGVSVAQAQIYLFVFLFSIAAGTILGGPLGDRFGRKYVIWGSILGVAPFTLALPYAGLVATVVLTVPIGVILASAFSAIIVYAQELVPGRVGMIAGLFFGFAFGVAGIASALLGKVADVRGIEYVYQVCSYLPLLGIITVFLPDLDRKRGLKDAEA